MENHVDQNLLEPIMEEDKPESTPDACLEADQTCDENSFFEMIALENIKKQVSSAAIETVPQVSQSEVDPQSQMAPKILKSESELLALLKSQSSNKMIQINGQWYQVDFPQQDIPTPMNSDTNAMMRQPQSLSDNVSSQENNSSSDKSVQGFKFNQMQAGLLNTTQFQFLNLPPLLFNNNIPGLLQQPILPPLNLVIPQSFNKIEEPIKLEESKNDSILEPELRRNKSEVQQLNRRFIVSERNIKGLTKNNGKEVPGPSPLSGLESIKEFEDLKKQISLKDDVVSKLSTFIIQHFSQKNISTSISDTDILDILSQAEMANSKLHLAFMFSSPLVKPDNRSDRRIPMEALDHSKEFQGVLESLSLTGMQINYQNVQATLDKITGVLNENPIALHFSGHGIRGQQSSFTPQNPLSKQKGPQGYLVIEDEKAQAYYLPDDLLSKIIKSQGVQPEFVFVSSCHSQFAGDIFHKAGAKHVICVKENYQISDEASIIFAKTFYTALFSQSKTVCQAFNIAKSHLQSLENRDIANEHVKFMLLKNNDEDKDSGFDVQKCANLDPTFFGMMDPLQKPQHLIKKHQCRIFGPLKEGKVTNTGTTPMFRVETSRVEDFIGRTIEMHHVISCIQTKRIVNIMGIPGIGKTTLVKAVAHFLDERQHMRDGIIVLSLRNLDQASMIIIRLELIINKKLLESQKDNKTNIETDDKVVLEKIVNFLKDKEVLLILDNAETPSKKDPKNFQEIIQTLLDSCPKLRFLFTSRYNVGSFGDHTEQVIQLKELQIKFAVDLLKRKAPREITDQEIDELLRIKPEQRLHSNPLKQEELSGLAGHHMFELLKGHPHAISLAAPLLQDKKLKELYQLLNSKDIMMWLENQGMKDDPMGSLKVSMDISIKQMCQTEPQAIRLFWMIGLLPGGCTQFDLNALWGEGWLNLAEKLLRSSLLVKKNIADENIYQLFPFMNQYAITNMPSEDKLSFGTKITKYYALLCQNLLKKKLEERLKMLVAIETNIWACIYSMRDKDDSMIRARSPGFSLQQNSHRTTPMSILTKDSHTSSSADIAPLSNGIQSMLSESGRNITTTSGNILHTEDNDSSDLHHTVGILDNLSSENDFYDKYDSILSQRITLGLGGKERSKSEKIKKNMRSVDNEVDNSDEEIKQDSQPQASLIFNKNNTIYLQNHPIDDSFNESLIQDLPILLTRQSSVESRQRFDLLVPANNNSNIMNQPQNTYNSFTNRPLYQQSLIGQNMQVETETNTSSGGGGFENILNTSFMQQLQQPFYRPTNFNDDQSIITNIHQFVQDDNSSIDSLQSILLLNTSNNPNANHQSNNNLSMDSSFYDGNTTIMNRSNYLSSNIMQRRQIQFNRDEVETMIPEEVLEESISMTEEEKANMSHMRSVERPNEENNLICIEDGNEDKENENAQNNSSDSENIIMENKIGAENNNISHNYNDLDLNRSFSSIDNENLKNEASDSKTTDSKLDIKAASSSLKKNNNNVTKKVNFQEQPRQTEDPQNNQANKKKVIRQLERERNIHKSNALQTESLMSLDGALLVYYVTNLLVIQKYEDSLKVIEQFGLKLVTDRMCIANIKKMQAYAIYKSRKSDYKEVKAKYEEALHLFLELKCILGQATCKWALGTLLFQHHQQFESKLVTDSKVFDMAKRRLEDAIILYSQCKHFAGESQCHRILQFIKQKSKENFTDHMRSYKALMVTENKLQSQGKSSFFLISNLTGDFETSLSLEVVGSPFINHEQQQQMMAMSRFNLKSTTKIANITSNPVIQKKKIDSTPQKEITNIQNVKKKFAQTLKNPEDESKRHDGFKPLAGAERFGFGRRITNNNPEQSSETKKPSKKLENEEIVSKLNLNNEDDYLPSIQEHRPSKQISRNKDTLLKVGNSMNTQRRHSMITQTIKPKIEEEKKWKHQPQVLVENTDQDSDSDFFDRASSEMQLTDNEFGIDKNLPKHDLDFSYSTIREADITSQQSSQNKAAKSQFLKGATTILNQKTTRKQLPSPNKEDKQTKKPQNIIKSQGPANNGKSQKKPKEELKTTARPSSSGYAQQTNILSKANLNQTSTSSLLSAKSPKSSNLPSDNNIISEQPQQQQQLHINPIPIVNNTTQQPQITQSTQYVSFNITTTTTVKVEGQMGQIPTSMTINPSVTLGSAQIQEAINNANITETQGATPQ